MNMYEFCFAAEFQDETGIKSIHCRFTVFYRHETGINMYDLGMISV